MMKGKFSLADLNELHSVGAVQSPGPLSPFDDYIIITFISFSVPECLSLGGYTLYIFIYIYISSPGPFWADKKITRCKRQAVSFIIPPNANKRLRPTGSSELWLA